VAGRLTDLQLLGDLGDRAAFGQQPVGFPQLADDLLERSGLSYQVGLGPVG
jgi:hypothetical protein